jgi:polyadenylate-binding protein
MFEEFGEIESAYVHRGENGELRDYGYVCFKDSDNAEKALEEMNKKQIGGDFLIVNKHISKKDTEGSKINPITQNLIKTFDSNIFIKFIPNEVTEEELREKFTMKDSKIISIKLNKWINKVEGMESSPYQFAYILYDTVAAAQKAIQTFDGSTVFGTRPLLVEQWVSKEEKELEKKRKENMEMN